MKGFLVHDTSYHQKFIIIFFYFIVDCITNCLNNTSNMKKITNFIETLTVIWHVYHIYSFLDLNMHQCSVNT